jgi:hypothetical protein
MALTSDDEQSVPIACTLGLSDLKTRLGELASLNSDALRHHERRGLELELVYAVEARERVHEMVRREKECCAFLNFELREDGENVRLIIRAPESARAVATLVFATFIGRAAPWLCRGC